AVEARLGPQVTDLDFDDAVGIELKRCRARIRIERRAARELARGDVRVVLRRRPAVGFEVRAFHPLDHEAVRCTRAAGLNVEVDPTVARFAVGPRGSLEYVRGGGHGSHAEPGA